MEYPEYYKILELPLNAEPADIKRQYRKLAKKYHPDLNAGDKNAEETFKKLKEAYEVLADKNKRNAYDLEWKKQRDKEKKQPKKSYEAKTQENVSPIKQDNPKKSASSKSTAKKKPKQSKKNFPFRAFRIFLSLSIIFSVMFFSLPKIIENKQKIADSYKEIKEITDGFDNYFLKKNVQNNELAEAEKILQKNEQKTAVSNENIVNFKNSDGYSLLMMSQTAEMSRMLIENGAEINYKAPDGATALLLAVKNNNLEQVRLLLDYKAEPNIVDNSNGTSALMQAKSEEIAYLLLKAGANPNFVAKDGSTPLSKASQEHNYERLNLLGQFGARINWSDVIGR